MRLVAKVKNGKFDFGDRIQKKLNEYLINFEGKEFFVDIEKITSKRSDEQNNYYWGVVIPLSAQELSLSHEMTHELFKIEFNKKTIKVEHPLNGQILRFVGGSTTKMSITSFVEYIERIRHYMAENYNLIIPDPEKTSIDEIIKDNLNNEVKEITQF